MSATSTNIFDPLKTEAKRLYRTVFPRNHQKLSYSQEGEDRILARIFGFNRNSGFYVDVGAFHPQEHSNTYLFYQKGWQGINIDARPGSMEIFKKIRPRDINLEIPISNTKQKLNYYIFNYPSLNGFSQKLSLERDRTGMGGLKAKLVSQIELETSTLSEILDKYLPINQTIDFLNIDVEGLDYGVLQSNNWDKYKPKIILVEDTEMITINQNAETPITSFMKEKGYQLFGKTVYTSIFKAEDFQGEY